MRVLVAACLALGGLIALVAALRRVLGARTGARLGHAAAALVFTSLFAGEATVLLTSWSELGALKRVAFVAVAVLLATFALQHMVRFRGASAIPRADARGEDGPHRGG